MKILTISDIEYVINNVKFIEYKEDCERKLNIKGKYKNLIVTKTPPFGKEESVATYNLESKNIYFYSSNIFKILNFFIHYFTDIENKKAILFILMKFLLAHELRHVYQDNEKELKLKYSKNPELYEKDADNFAFDALGSDDLVTCLVKKGLKYYRSNNTYPGGWNVLRDEIGIALSEKM